MRKWIVLVLVIILWLAGLPDASPVDAADSVTSIGLGANFSCAVSNKQVWCWGRNQLGQLGDGTEVDRVGAVQVTKVTDSLPLVGATKVAAGYNHACAIVNKQVWCWGNNSVGELGISNATTKSSRAVLVQKESGGTLEAVTDIALGTAFSCAISNKQVWCWGANASGQLGDNSTSEALSGAIQASNGGAPLSNVTAIATGDSHACAVITGAVWCWGANDVGQLGNDTTSSSELLAVQVVLYGGGGPLTGASKIVSRYDHTCVIALRLALCWGANGAGQLGTTDTTSYPSARMAKKVDGSMFTSVTMVATGSPFSCAAADRGVWCWGQNNRGALADNTIVNKLGGVASQYLGGVTMSGTVSVFAGLSHACAIINKQAWCWGDNTYGQVGDGSKTHRSGAIRVVFDQTTSIANRSLQPATSVSAGADHSCAIINKQAWCWGSNSDGQLGVAGTIGIATYGAYVVRSDAGVPLTNVTNISSGTGNSCAVVNKQAWCWGNNTNGQLGDNSTTPRDGAVQVQTSIGTLSDVTAISVGTNLVCAVAKKNAWCWGSAPIGDGSSDNSLVAKQVVMSGSEPLTNVTAVSAGLSHACAISSKKVYCWGGNSVGQVGNDDTAQTLVAVPVLVDVTYEGGGDPQLTKATQVAVAASTSCALNNKEVYCWGDNTYGQLGFGATTPVSRAIARRVRLDATTIMTGASLLVAGSRYACAVANNQLRCWGRNHVGQLGDNTTDDRYYAVLTTVDGTNPVPKVAKIATGAAHSCAIYVSDKRVRCWGGNSDGQLGDGTADNSPVPVPAYIAYVYLTGL